MIIVNKNKINETVSFTVHLGTDIELMGTLMPIAYNSMDAKNITISDTYITGETSSKLSYIKNSLTGSEDYLAGGINGQPLIITIRGTNIKSQITYENQEKTHVKYVLYVGTRFPIEYDDLDGVTTFRFKPLAEFNYLEGAVFMLGYWGLIDEPKLDANVFMNRGVNNIFGDFRRMKTIKTIEELKDSAFGYFRLYDGGFN